MSTKRYSQTISLGLEPETEQVLRDYIGPDVKKWRWVINQAVFESVSAYLDAREKGNCGGPTCLRLEVTDGASHWHEHCNLLEQVDKILATASVAASDIKEGGMQ